MIPHSIGIDACIPVIPCADIEKSLRFWVDTIGLTPDRHMRQENRLVGCMVHNEQTYFWLNEKPADMQPENYEGIRLYWTPTDIHAAWERLKQFGYAVSQIEVRDYGQTEFFLTDGDGYSHCFGVTTK